MARQHAQTVEGDLALLTDQSLLLKEDNSRLQEVRARSERLTD